MSDEAKAQDDAADAAEVVIDAPAVEPVAPAGEAAPGAKAEADATESQGGPEVARSRPSSLRAAATAASNIPRSRLTPPSFPGAPAFPGSDVRVPVSGSAEQGNSGEVPSSGPSQRRRLPLGKLPVNKLPVDRITVDKDAVDRLGTLVKQRPEVGLGIAFAGGLLIATMLKRLGRR